MTALSPTSRQRRFILLVIVQVTWLAMVCLMALWWGTVIRSQSEQIATLESRLGVATSQSLEHYHRVQTMLTWESAAFFGLLILVSAALFWLHFRDLRRSRSLHAFFAGVTHELRTPLTSIRLQAESLAEGEPQGSSRTRLVDRLIEDTARLEAQVERTLELARLEGGGRLHSRPISLKSWVERFVRNWQMAHGRKIEIEFDVEEVTVLADPNALAVVLRNLLENTLRHADVAEPRVRITARAGELGAWLEVQDNGERAAGDQKWGVLFEKSERSSGAGVGLYLVRTLVERMGGSAEFEGRRPGFKVKLALESATEGNAHGG